MNIHRPKNNNEHNTMRCDAMQKLEKLPPNVKPNIYHFDKTVLTVSVSINPTVLWSI